MTHAPFEQFDAFGDALLAAASSQLKDHIDPINYTELTLDEIWDSEGFFYLYHEIPAHMTKSGNPFVVSHLEDFHQ